MFLSIRHIVVLWYMSRWWNAWRSHSIGGHNFDLKRSTGVSLEIDLFWPSWIDALQNRKPVSLGGFSFNFHSIIALDRRWPHRYASTIINYGREDSGRLLHRQSDESTLPRSHNGSGVQKNVINIFSYFLFGAEFYSHAFGWEIRKLASIDAQQKLTLDVCITRADGREGDILTTRGLLWLGSRWPCLFRLLFSSSNLLDRHPDTVTTVH